LFFCYRSINVTKISRPCHLGSNCCVKLQFLLLQNFGHEYVFCGHPQKSLLAREDNQVAGGGWHHSKVNGTTDLMNTSMIRALESEVLNLLVMWIIAQFIQHCQFTHCRNNSHFYISLSVLLLDHLQLDYLPLHYVVEMVYPRDNLIKRVNGNEIFHLSFACLVRFAIPFFHFW